MMGAVLACILFSFSFLFFFFFALQVTKQRLAIGAPKVPAIAHGLTKTDTFLTSLNHLFKL